ncbi:MAG: hypothetical protein IJQ25_07280 [Oscillibacter sp.]|nr:hypothetical protein [Oscillibacter sp.]
MTRRRIGAALTATLMMGALLSACLVLGVHAGHGCHGRQCPVCVELQACAEQFQTARTTGSASALTALTPAFRRETPRSPVSAPCFRTLVTWKVKLSN